MRRITKTVIWIGIGGLLYFIAGNHFIYFGGLNIKLLKKKQLTFSHTFFSTSLKTNKAILSDDVLREAGIGDLLVEMGLISKKKKEILESRFEKQQEDRYE